MHGIPTWMRITNYLRTELLSDVIDLMNDFIGDKNHLKMYGTSCLLTNIMQNTIMQITPSDLMTIQIITTSWQKIQLSPYTISNRLLGHNINWSLARNMATHTFVIWYRFGASSVWFWYELCWMCFQWHQCCCHSKMFSHFTNWL